VLLSQRLLLGLVVSLAIYVLAVLALAATGRPSDAGVLAGFIPVAGQLDDAILVAAVLRLALRAGGEELLEEHWRGPPRTLELVRRLAFADQAAGRCSS
jgi:hypothetical protein